MKHRFASVRRSALATVAASATAFALLAPAVVAQEIKADVGKPVFDDLPSPDVKSGKEKTFKPKDWLEVEASLKISGTAEQKKIGYINTVTVKWYVGLRNPDGKGAIKLVKTINHINVPVDDASFHFPATASK